MARMNASDAIKLMHALDNLAAEFADVKPAHVKTPWGAQQLVHAETCRNASRFIGEELTARAMSNVLT